MKSKLLLVAALVCACTPAIAGDSKFTKQFTICMNDSSGVMPDMIACVEEETKIHDARLNGAYKTLGEQLTRERKKALLAAQRLWIQYRDANCAFYADPDGGQMATFRSAECVLDATAIRATELEDIIEYEAVD